MADVTIQIETTGGDDIVKNIDKGTEAAKSLKAQLREAKTELQNLADQPGVDPAKIEAAAKKVGELTDAIGDANDMAKNFSGNKFENVSQSLGGVKNALMNLDFSKANDMAKNFAANAKGISFGGAISSVKDLGSTFMTLGKALLTNPLFLIGAVIAVLVMAIVKVLDKLGLLKKIAEAVGKVFDFLMGVLEGVVSAITDLLGVTSEAERQTVAAMERTAKASEKAALTTKNANEETIQGIDHKIKRYELEGKSTTNLERQKVQLLRETAATNFKAAQDAYKLALRKGDMDAKEIADLKEKVRISRLSYKNAKEDVVDFEAGVVAEKKKANEKKQKEDDDAAKVSADKAAAARKEALEKQKEYEKQRLDTTRLLEDLRTSLIIDQYDREVVENQLKYDRLIADTTKNEKLIQSEKDALNAIYEQQKKTNEEKIKKDKEKSQADDKAAKEAADAKDLSDMVNAENEAWKKEKELMDLKASYIADAELRAQTERQNAYAQELVDLQNHLDNGLITREEYDNMTKQAEINKNEDLKKINEEYRKEQKEAEKELREQRIDAILDTLSVISGITELFAGKSRKQQESAFKVQKAANIASALIDTYKGAAGAFASTPGGPVIKGLAAAAATVAGLLNVKKIANTKFSPEGGGGGGDNSTSTAPEGPINTPMPAPAPTPNAVTINGVGENMGSMGAGLQLYGGRQTPIRSYVVESDITNTQNTLETYSKRAEIG